MRIRTRLTEMALGMAQTSMEGCKAALKKLAKSDFEGSSVHAFLLAVQPWGTPSKVQAERLMTYFEECSGAKWTPAQREYIQKELAS